MIGALIAVTITAAIAFFAGWQSGASSQRMSDRMDRYIGSVK